MLATRRSSRLSMRARAIFSRGSASAVTTSSRAVIQVFQLGLQEKRRLRRCPVPAHLPSGSSLDHQCRRIYELRPRDCGEPPPIYGRQPSTAHLSCNGLQRTPMNRPSEESRPRDRPQAVARSGYRNRPHPRIPTSRRAPRHCEGQMTLGLRFLVT